MRYIKSCGFIAYKQIEGRNYYLIIKSLNGDVGFPKGHMEIGESELETAIRELKEETGIDTGELEEIYRIIHQKNQSIYYGYLLKTACDKEAIQLQENETIAYQWISKNELFEFYDNQCSPTLKERLKDYIESIR